MEVQQAGNADRRKAIMGLRGYLMANWYGLRDYRMEVKGEGLRGLGAIEGNVDKVIATRMKKRGMSWTIKGAHRMLTLIRLRESGQLHPWMSSMDMPWQIQPFKQKRNCRKAPDEHVGAWLEAGMPVLYGPHQNRPLAQVLRALTQQILEV